MYPLEPYAFSAKSMIWIDYTILGLVTICTIAGLLRGFLREAFALISWIGAIWIGLHYNRYFAIHLEHAITSPIARLIVAFIILFFATLLVASLINYLLAELIKKTGLTGLDRLAGLLFGMGKGILIVSVIVLLAGLTPLCETPWWREALLISPIHSLALWMRDHLGGSLATYVRS